MDEEDDFTAEASPRTKLGVIVVVIVLHVLAIAGIIRAFAPGFTSRVADVVLSTFTVTVVTPPPAPEPSKAPEKAGASGAQGKKAVAREVKAVRPRVDVAKKTEPAPKAASTGNADTSGAANAGSGTGAGGPGSGPGASGSGSGQGGGAATRAVHVAGEISNARDLPVPPGGREARIGKATILALTVSPDGRVVACRVHRSSGFPETDEAVCALARKRLRFRPATNSAGEPVTSTFYWQQKYFS
jgi:protein TonB